MVISTIVWHLVLVVLVIIWIYGASALVVALGILIITRMAVKIFIPAWVAIMTSHVILLLFSMAMTVLVKWEVRDTSVGQEFCDGDVIIIKEFGNTNIIVLQEFTNGVVKEFSH